MPNVAYTGEVSAESGYKLSSSYSLLGEYAVDICDVDCGVDIRGVDICDVEGCDVVDSSVGRSFSFNRALLRPASAI